MIARSTSRSAMLAALAAILVLSAHVQAEVVPWRTSVDAAKVEAAQSGKLVLLHFWGTSCGPCRKLESDVFSQPQVGDFLGQNFVPVKIEVGLSPALASAYNITRIPTDVVLTPQGNVVASLACPLTPDAYGGQLSNLVQHYRQATSKHAAPLQPSLQSAYAGLKVGQYQQTATTPNAVSATTVSNSNLAPAPSSPTAPVPQVTHNIYATASPSPTAGVPPVQAQAPTLPPQPASTVASTAGVAPPTMAHPAASVPPTRASVASASAEPTAKGSPKPSLRLPPGSAPLAFEGYCSVTLKQSNKWVLGDTRYGVTHRGRTYLFAGEPERQQFLANPDAYSPVFSGMDAVKMLEENQAVEGSRKYGFQYRGAFYLFASQESMERFASQPDRYAAGVRQAMARLDGSSDGATLRR